MLDFQYIGKEGILVQYEDIISLTGYNIANYLKARGFNQQLEEEDNKKMLLSYFDREEYDIIKWLSDTYMINVSYEDFDKSLSAHQPNMLYSFKVFKAAFDNGIRVLKVYSDTYSPAIEEFVKHYPVPVEYCYGDLKNHLKPNMTVYATRKSLIDQLKIYEIPLALVVVDDFMYVKDIIPKSYVDGMMEKHIFTQFTSILSGGFI